MAKPSLVKGNQFTFGKEQGFTGSCGGTPVKGYMRGGSVKGGFKPFAKGGKIMPSDKEHKDYDDKNDTSDDADYPEVGSKSKPAGYAKGGLNLKMKKGALHKQMGIKSGEKIPAKKLAAAAHSKNPLEAKRARFAETMKKWKHAKGGMIDKEPAEGDAKGGRIMKKATGGSCKMDKYAHGGRMPGAVAGAKHRSKMGGAKMMAGALMGGAPGGMMAPPPPAPPAMGGGGMGPAPGGPPPMMAKGGKR